MYNQNSQVTTSLESAALLSMLGLDTLELHPELPQLVFDADVSALDAEAEMLKANRELAQFLPGIGRYVEDINLSNFNETRFVIFCDKVFYEAFVTRLAEQSESITLDTVAELVA